MGKYSQSEWAKNLTHQATNAATNAASASGLSGSTPLSQQIAQNAGQISSADQNQWLQNVLGINTQYGEGQNRMMGYGQHAADELSSLDAQQGGRAGVAAYGQSLGKQNDRNEIMEALTQFLKTYNPGGQGGGTYTGGPQYPHYLGY